MLFNSLPFLYAFLPITYVVFWRLETRRARHVWLAVTGYVFYGAWNWKFCFLMALSTVVSYSAGLALRRTEDAERRRLLLIVPVTLDLCLLGFFKYLNFGLRSATAVAGWLGSSWHGVGVNVILPVGISFYTFHTISYIVDSYRRDIEPTTDFWEFACYVSLFSQLVAGPIVRFRQVVADLEGLGAKDRRAGLERGWSFFAVGLAQKVLIADTLARLIDPRLASWHSLSTAGAWACMLGYSYQLYFDFAGYSNMAVGLGHLFGIHIPQNFDSPYKATNPSDFWRRWNISLSSCLRDYLYIPLGGNRGTATFIARNLMLTMAIGGLWHGANWTFVLWGVYHGLLLVAYRFRGRAWDRLPVPAQRAGMFLAAVIGWVLFRATDLTMAGGLLARMFMPATSGAAFPGLLALAGLLAISAGIAHATPNTFELRHRWGRPAVAGMALAFAAAVAILFAGTPSPFLYFQF